MVIFGTVKGLVSDSRKVSDLIMEIKPQAVCLHISREEIEGLEDYIENGSEELDPSNYDVIYSRKLSKYGKVKFPSPSLISGMKTARKIGAEIYPLDLDEESYSELYTSRISGMTMIRSSLKLKSINRMKFSQKTPEDFIIEWDKVSNQMRSFRELEEKREEHMAKQILEIHKEKKSIVCIIELERMKGILGYLRK